LIGYRCFVQQVENLFIIGFDSMTGIDQHINPPQGAAPLQVGEYQSGPRVDSGFGCFGEAIARHVYQGQWRYSVIKRALLDEKIELLCASGGIGGSRQPLFRSQRVYQGRFAHIRAPGKSNLRWAFFG